MKTSKPKNFQLKLSSVGTDSFNGTYGLIKSDNALDLLIKVNKTISKDFVGEEGCLYLLYDLKLWLDDALKLEGKRIMDQQLWDINKVYK